MPVLIVGAYPRQRARGRPPGAALDRMRREVELTVIPIAGLGRDETRDLLTGMLGEIDDALVTNLHTRTIGNPLLLRIRAIASDATVGHAPPALDGGVPEGIPAVVRQRLDRLSPTTANMLALASVCGSELDFATLVTIAELDEDDLIAAVEEASSANLIVELPGDGERIAFTHTLVRDTLYESFSSLRRRRLHRRVADHLIYAVSNDPRSIVELARHLLASDPELMCSGSSAVPSTPQR